MLSLINEKIFIFRRMEYPFLRHKGNGVPTVGFEPTTFGSGDQRSNPLSYAGK